MPNLLSRSPSQHFDQCYSKMLQIKQHILFQVWEVLDQSIATNVDHKIFLLRMKVLKDEFPIATNKVCIDKLLLYSFLNSYRDFKIVFLD
jgi:hypothetical protein